MKYNISFVFLILSSTIFFFSSCKNDDKDSNGCYIGLGANTIENRTIPSFTGIEIQLEVEEVNLKVGTPIVTVETHSDIQQYVLVEVINDVLTISSPDNSCFNLSNPIKIDITVDDQLNLIDNRANNTRIKNSSTLQLEQLTVRNINAGIVELNGTCNDLEIINVEAGEIKMFEFYSQNTAVDQSSRNPIECRVLNDGTLTILLKGDGNVLYKGIPNTIDDTILGNGIIIDAN